VWDARIFTTNDTLYIVGSYTFGTVANTTDDVCKMWINPTPAELGAASPTSTPLIAAVGSDISSDQIASFVLLQRSASEPPVMFVDELRIDTTWAGVTGKSAPLVITPPSDHEVIAGSNAPFSVLANGTSPITYQWQFNGGAISGATTTNYTRTNVGAFDAGSYTVVLSNSVGVVTSAVARLIVDLPPTITPQLTSLSANQDGSFTMLWTAAAGVLYHFQYADSISNAQWTTIADYTATSNSLSVIDGPLTNSSRFYQLSSATAASSPAGFLRLSALGNSDTIVSLPFARPGAISATVATVAANAITVTGSPNWTANQFV
jgi:hypothetical protein